MNWVEAASLKTLTRRKRTLVVVEGRPIALFLVGETVYALHDICIHKQRSLSKGAILHGRIICPGHQWSYDPATGEAEGQGRFQPTYPVMVENDVVYVDPRPRIRSGPGDPPAAERTADQSDSEGAPSLAGEELR